MGRLGLGVPLDLLDLSRLPAPQDRAVLAFLRSFRGC